MKRPGQHVALGHHATWCVPTVLGLYSVYDASPQMRTRTLFEEGFRIDSPEIVTRHFRQKR